MQLKPFSKRLSVPAATTRIIFANNNIRKKKESLKKTIKPFKVDAKTLFIQKPYESPKRSKIEDWLLQSLNEDLSISSECIASSSTLSGVW